MNPSNPLESIYFINIPKLELSSCNSFEIDPTIPLPVQKKTGETGDNFNPKEIKPEQILAGMLTILAYDSKNTQLDYYRSLLKKIKPNLKKELCEAAILKTKNEDFDLAEEIFRALIGYTCFYSRGKTAGRTCTASIPTSTFIRNRNGSFKTRFIRCRNARTW